MAPSAPQPARTWIIVVALLGWLLLALHDDASTHRAAIATLEAASPRAALAEPAARAARSGAARRPAAPERVLAPMPASIPDGRWQLVMGPVARQLFRASVASTPPHLRAVLDGVGAATTVRVLHRTRCGEHSSCAIGRVVEVDGVRTGTYTVQLDADHVDRTMASRFLMLHELAHVVDYHGIDDAAMGRFEQAFRASPQWRACFVHEGTCVALDELFADQFAIHATGQRRSLTSYRIPRLLDDATFGKLLQETYDPAG